MNLKWFVVPVLMTWIHWSATPAAAQKVKHFKDDQGTLHITNEKPEDKAAPGVETAPDGTIKLRVQEPKPPGGAFPPPPPAGEGMAEAPDEGIEAPEAPQPEEVPEEPPPDEGG